MATLTTADYRTVMTTCGICLQVKPGTIWISHSQRYVCKDCLWDKMATDPAAVLGDLDLPLGSCSNCEDELGDMPVCTSCSHCDECDELAMYCEDHRGKAECEYCGDDAKYCSAACAISSGDGSHECDLSECAGCGDTAYYCSATCAIDDGSSVWCGSCGNEAEHIFCSAACAVDEGAPGMCGHCGFEVVASINCTNEGCSQNKTIAPVPSLAAASPIVQPGGKMIEQTKVEVDHDTGVVTLDGVEFRF